MYLRMRELLERNAVDYVRLKCGKYGPTRTKKHKPMCKSCDATATAGHWFVCGARDQWLIRQLNMVGRMNWWQWSITSMEQLLRRVDQYRKEQTTWVELTEEEK